MTDNVTKLVWEDYVDVGDSTKKKSWKDAITYCEGLSHAGRNDWRLPNINELISILNYEKSAAPIYKDVFERVQGFTYWTSTSTLNLGLDKGFMVNANIGNTYADEKRNEHNVICVADKQ